MGKSHKKNKSWLAKRPIRGGGDPSPSCPPRALSPSGSLSAHLRGPPNGGPPPHQALSHLVSLSMCLFLPLSLKWLTTQTQTTAMTASMAARTGGGEPKDAEMVATSPFHCETPSLEMVEVRVGLWRKWRSNTGQRPFLTVVLNAIVFISTSSL